MILQAFRYLSHKFHGKAPGKLKSEKRQKKFAEDLVDIILIVFRDKTFILFLILMNFVGFKENECRRHSSQYSSIVL